METSIYIANHNGAEFEIEIGIELDPIYTNDGSEDIFVRWDIDHISCDPEHEEAVYCALKDHYVFEEIVKEWEEYIIEECEK